MKLSIEDLLFLKSELSKTSIMNDDELRYIKSAHDIMYYTSHNIKVERNILYTKSCWFYNLKNTELNKFLCEKFNEPLNNLYTIHRLLYDVGGKCEKHMDRFTTYKTVSILLSSNFTGGEMYINDENVSLKNEGDYVVFSGGNESHEVKEVITGERDVLIVWFSKKKAKFSII